MKDSLLIHNKSKLDRQPEKISHRQKKTQLSRQAFMNMLFVWIVLPGVLWMYTTSSTENLWKSEILFCVCHRNVCFSIVLYINKGVHTNKQTKKVWQTIRNQDSVVILFCCVLAYIRPVLSFDCLLSLFSLLEGYWMYNRMWISFSFIYCVHATACYFQKRSEMSQAHLRCTVNIVNWDT